MKGLRRRLKFIGGHTHRFVPLAIMPDFTAEASTLVYSKCAGCGDTKTDRLAGRWNGNWTEIFARIDKGAKRDGMVVIEARS